MKMKFPILLSILMAGTMAGCSPVEPEEEITSTQKDAYKSLQDCMDDWGDKDLCMQAQETMQAQANAQAQANQQGGGTNVAVVPIFYGPEYHSGQRTAYNAQGKAVFPKGNHAYRVSPPLKPSNTYLSRRSAAMQAISKSSGYTPSGKSSSFFSGGSRSSVIGGSHGFSGGG